MLHELIEWFDTIAFLDVQTSVVYGMLCLFWMYILLRKPSGLPPGPSWRAPVLGHLREFTRSSNLRQVLAKYRKRYGEVYSLYLGRRLVVIVNGLDAIKEAFVKRRNTFSFHPNTIVQQARSHTFGASDTSGSQCKAWNLPTLDTLKAYGLDMAAIETTVSKEIDRLLEDINVYHDQVFNPKHIITKSIINANYSVTLGTEYSYNDTEFKRLLSLTRRCVTSANTSGLLNFLPFLRHLPGDYFRFNEFKKTSRTLNRYFNFRIEACEEDLKDGRNATSTLALSYQRALKECLQDQSDKKAIYSDDSLKTVLSDILGSGSEHTADTLCCAIRFLCDHPQIQNQIYKEITSLVGDSRRPCLADRSCLLYTIAFLEETRRMSNLFSLGPPHTSDEDVHYAEHIVPKGSVIFPDVQSVLSDPNLWEEPEMFQPERFMFPKDCLLSELSETMPFLVGK